MSSAILWKGCLVRVFPGRTGFCTCRGAGQLVWIQGVPNEVQSEVQQVVVVVVVIVNVGFPPGFSLCNEQMHVAQFDTTFWSICEVRQFLNLRTPQQITCATC